MFSQTKQTTPTIKMVIKSKLPNEKITQELDNTKASSIEVKPISTPSNIESSSLPVTSPVITSINTLSTDNSVDKKRKRNDKDNFSLASKKVHLHLERWNQKHEELISKNKEKEQDSLESTSDNNISEEQEDFADYTRMACLLCQRKFKTPNDISRHQALSELHKKNSKDPIAIETARTKKQQLIQSSTNEKNQDQEESITSTTPYRNRAAERRQKFNQPENPIPIKHNPIAESSKRQQPTHEHVSISNPISEKNLGAKMMKQMGWKQGEGLGKESSGIVNPIMAERYSKGVGLGTSNAKHKLDHQSNDRDSYKERAKELARQRLLEEL
ncbi:hypothetical protein BJ944DRAFT_263878 [Cunninghamella echinulata]|nr:hypothetical protein BJ944DRAFT_263878 [Cunninghamella echinulata]